MTPAGNATLGGGVVRSYRMMSSAQTCRSPRLSNSRAAGSVSASVSTVATPASSAKPSSRDPGALPADGRVDQADGHRLSGILRSYGGRGDDHAVGVLGDQAGHALAGEPAAQERLVGHERQAAVDGQAPPGEGGDCRDVVIGQRAPGEGHER